MKERFNRNCPVIARESLCPVIARESSSKAIPLFILSLRASPRAKQSLLYPVLYASLFVPSLRASPRAKQSLLCPVVVRESLCPVIARASKAIPSLSHLCPRAKQSPLCPVIASESSSEAIPSLSHLCPRAKQSSSLNSSLAAFYVGTRSRRGLCIAAACGRELRGHYAEREYLEKESPLT